MRVLLLTAIVFLSGCSGYENDKIETAAAKENNKLLIPPCLNRG
jgi:PBP1b-binding outer membrane lipoprotein LpoB